jgi:hypothetical protein
VRLVLLFLLDTQHLLERLAHHRLLVLAVLVTKVVEHLVLVEMVVMAVHMVVRVAQALREAELVRVVLVPLVIQLQVMQISLTFLLEHVQDQFLKRSKT